MNPLLKPLLEARGLAPLYLAHMEKRASLPEAVLSITPPRTPGISGYAPALPEVGKPMLVYGEPIDPSADVRLWSTSLVTEVTEDTNGGGREGVRLFRFKTLNSEYTLLLETLQ